MVYWKIMFYSSWEVSAVKQLQFICESYFFFCDKKNFAFTSFHNFFSVSLRWCCYNSRVRWKKTLPGKNKCTSDQNPKYYVGARVLSSSCWPPWWDPQPWERRFRKAARQGSVLGGGCLMQPLLRGRGAFSPDPGSLIHAAGSHLLPRGISCLEHF